MTLIMVILDSRTQPAWDLSGVDVYADNRHPTIALGLKSG